MFCPICNDYCTSDCVFIHYTGDELYPEECIIVRALKEFIEKPIYVQFEGQEDDIYVKLTDSRSD